MSRNGSGVFSAPAGNPVIAGTVISTVWANATVTDLGNEITNSLPRDGQAPMTGQLKLANGSVGIPALTFNSEANTGLYRVGAGDIAIGIGGTKVLGLTGTTASVTGNLTLSGTGVLSANKADINDTLVVPVGTTAQRDAVPEDGLLRYNTDLKQFEGYFNSSWQSVGGGQLLGNALTKAIFYNSTTIGENLTIAASTNGMTAGPITVNDTFSVTVSDSSVWSIV